MARSKKTSLTGHLTQEHAGTVRDFMVKLLSGATADSVTVDLTQVDSVSCGSLQAFLAAQAQGKSLVFSGAHPQVQEALALVGIQA